MQKKLTSLSLAESEALAAQAFAFLCAERERAERFLRLTGLEPSSLPALAAEPGFLAGVLEHLLGDEALLLTFCANQGIDPQLIAAAQRRLADPPPDGPGA